MFMTTDREPPYHPMDWGWGMMAGHGLGWFLVLAVVVVVLVVLVRNIGSGSQDESPSRSALQILEERYARGEIERGEYLQKKQDLL